MRRLLALVFLAGACVGGVEKVPAAPAATGEPTQRGGRLVIASTGEIRTLQPLFAGSDTSQLTARIIGLMYEPLWRFDPHTGEPKPNLARWSVSADGLLWTAEIAANANWSDGRPILAEDWLTHLKAVARSKKPQSDFSGVVGFTEYAQGRATSIAGVATDGKKMSIAFTAVRCTRMPFGSLPLPAHYFGRYLDDRDLTRNLDEAAENDAPPVASGPFMLAEWRKGDSIRLKRNPTYWKGSALLDEVEIRIVSGRGQAIEELRAGRVHLDTDIPVADVPALERAGLKIVRHQHVGYTYLGWNLRRAELNGLGDRRIRQALAYGLDTDAVIRGVLDGAGTNMFTHHASSSWAFPSGHVGMFAYASGQLHDIEKWWLRR